MSREVSSTNQMTRICMSVYIKQNILSQVTFNREEYKFIDIFIYSRANVLLHVHVHRTSCPISPSSHQKPGPNFIELLKHKILLKQKNPCLVKSDYRPRLHSIVMLSKQQLNTSHKQCIWHEILASNMCKISELFSCLSNFLLKQLYEIGPWW